MVDGRNTVQYAEEKMKMWMVAFHQSQKESLGEEALILCTAMLKLSGKSTGSQF